MYAQTCVLKALKQPIRLNWEDGHWTDVSCFEYRTTLSPSDLIIFVDYFVTSELCRKLIEILQDIFQISYLHIVNMNYVPHDAYTESTKTCLSNENVK